MRLASKIDNLTRRLQRRRLVAAACWATAILIATALGLAACDRLLGVADSWGRAILTAALASACFFVARRVWRSVLSRPVDSMKIASRIERHRPELRDMITSSLEFSQQARDDPFAGSESLRRAVVIHTSVELEDLDWQQFVPRRPLRRAMLVAGGMLLVVGLLSWWAPQSLGIGLARLLNPMSDSEWPRTHQKFVALPPEIKNLQIKVHPPAYTGLPSRPLGKNGRVLAGSGLQLSAECDQPLASVVLRGERGLTISATLHPTNKQFHISQNIWRAEASDLFSLELTTKQSTATCRATVPQQFTLKVIPDHPPQVQISQPKTSLSVTPAAVVPLVITATDDLAIRNIKLIFRHADRPQQDDQTISLFQNSNPQGPRQQQLEYLWQLEPLSLRPGAVLEIHAQATDYQPSTGKMRYPLRIRIVSLQDLLREISTEDLRLLATLERLLHEQTELRGLVLQWSQEQDRPWPEVFRVVSARQRQMTTALADPQGGVLRALEELITVYSRNQLDRQASINCLQALHELLSVLVAKPLRDTQRLLGQLRRESRRPTAADIAALAERQQAAMKTLQQAIESLSQENELARFESNLARIEARQQELAERSLREILNSQSPAKTNEQASLAQRQLSRRFAKLVLQMSRATENQSINSASLSETVSLARDLGVQAMMRTAADHLAKQQIGKASALQQKARDHLRQLRERLIQGNAGEQKPGNVNTPKTGDPKNASATDPGNQPEGSGEAGTKPNASSSLTRPTRNSPTEKTASQLINDLWGNLPPRQREQILQPLGETFLPKYAEEIQAYFRELAQPASETKDSP